MDWGRGLAVGSMIAGATTAEGLIRAGDIATAIGVCRFLLGRKPRLRRPRPSLICTAPVSRTGSHASCAIACWRFDTEMNLHGLRPSWCESKLARYTRRVPGRGAAW